MSRDTTISGQDGSIYDVVIVGGGMVGSLLAAALASTGSLKIAVLEPREPRAFEPGTQPEYDLRVSALSIATQRMMEKVGAWPGVVSRRACPYREMKVWDSEAGGTTHFHAHEVGAPALGHIVENRVVQLALLDVIRQAGTIDYLCPSQLVSLHGLPGYVLCRLNEPADTEDSCQSIKARLVVGADGARSRVRELAGIELKQSKYPQSALVATVETTRSQAQITWQRFKPSGPEAFLPLCGNRASLVWYHDDEQVERLVEMAPSDFLSELLQTFPDEDLGGVERVLERGSFPISKAQADRYIAPRIALIGDAAHTVHPLAGQGVNLGMLDAAALAEVIINTAQKSRDIGSPSALRRYERWRQSENAMMISILDGFYHAFKPHPQPVRSMRSMALNVADNVRLIKRQVMGYAMGTGSDLPSLAR